MSTVDLLRRASVALEDAVEGLPSYLRHPWTPCYTDSESLTGVRACERHEETRDHVCARCAYFETYSENAARYVALMHPALGKYLRAWLWAVAADLEDFGGEPVNPAQGREASTAETIARAILREPEGR